MLNFVKWFSLLIDIVWFCFSYLFVYLLFLVIGNFELYALHLPGKCSTTQATPPALFGFSYFLSRISCFCPGLASGCDSTSYASA
jgi:hypothetical protein